MRLCKSLMLCTALLMASLPQAQAQLNGIPQPTDPAAQAVLAALMACGEDKLGGKNGLSMAQAMGEQANRQIVAFCRAGNKARAHETAVYYAGTEEGKVLLECASQLKPLVQQPPIQQLLGQYKNMVNDILNGTVPQDVCVGIQPQSNFYSSY